MQIMRRAIDVSMGGVRVYSDIELETGEEIKMELFLPDGEAVEFTCRVAWIERLPAKSPAKFDVGLSFVDVDPAARSALQTVLAPADD
jgi:Tfp pilus assembly protein PilZ